MLAQGCPVAHDGAVKPAIIKKTSRKVRNAASSPKAARAAVTGEPIATLSNGIFVIRTKHGGHPWPIRSSDKAGVLLGKLGKALNTPGLTKRDVFGSTPSKKVFSYYVDERNPSMIIRESADGKKMSGRVVDGKFRAR